MCGRYTGNIDENEELRAIYKAALSAYPDTDFASGEIFPSNTVPLLTGIGGILRPFAASWGFPTRDGKLIINARAETAAEKPIFAESFMRRRCIVPTTGYFEGSHKADRTKYLFNRLEHGILYLGGLWLRYDDGVRFVILTTAANLSVSDIHHRMPLILTEDALVKWSTDVGYAKSFVTSEMPSLLHKAV